jgi:hypothetical protein
MADATVLHQSPPAKLKPLNPGDKPRVSRLMTGGRLKLGPI